MTQIGGSDSVRGRLFKACPWLRVVSQGQARAWRCVVGSSGVAAWYGGRWLRGPLNNCL